MMLVALVEQRLDSVAVPGQVQHLRALVPDGQAKHAVELREDAGPILLESAQYHLRIGAGVKPVSVLEETPVIAQLTEVVDLAVVRELNRSVCSAHGLVPRRREIDDRQPPIPQANPLTAPGAAI